jgi:Fe-S cluster biogenesis protein NfuA
VAAKNGTNSGELMDRINAVIDENVRPALAGDGGGLEVISLEGYTLTIHYQGACGSCPSATAGTMGAVQNLLQRLVDPRIKVVSDAGMMGHY